MKRFGRIVRTLGLLFILVLAGFAIFVAMRQHLTYDDIPLPAVTASTDSAVVERGRYLVRSVADCATCHGDPSMRGTVAEDSIPLSGGFEFHIPPGVFRPRNITPDVETGIGGFSDGQVARALRYGVGHDGRALLPFMEMQGLADDDLVAIVSYLRTQPPVMNRVPDHEYNLLGKIVRATALAKPVGPSAPPPAHAPREPGVETGRYLAGSVANCWACHTERSQNTGELLGPKFSGAHTFTDESGSGRVWAPPNLTPDPKTGRLVKMSEDDFVARMRQGRLLPGSPMPYEVIGRMKDDDLRSIYRFLMSLPPVENDVGPPVRETGKGA